MEGMALSVPSFLRTHFPAPRYLALPTAGLDLASGAVKHAALEPSSAGLFLSHVGSRPLEQGVIEDGDIGKEDVIVSILKEELKDKDLSFAHVSLPEQKMFLFTITLPDGSLESLKEETAAHLEEYVPLPRSEVVFDIFPLRKKGKEVRVVGVAYARRIISSYNEVCRKTGIFVRGFEPEAFAVSRALMHKGDDSTSLIIDMGKTSTKLIVTEGQTPVYTASFAIGGQTLTEVVEKHFGVGEEEAVRIKIEQGLSLSNKELLESMLLTLSAVREEVSTRFEYWQKRSRTEEGVSPIERVYLVGGNANIRGLPEYLIASLGIPVSVGNVFTNLAPFDEHLPDIEQNQSLTYAVSIGLALRSFDTSYD
jgi:type IV pilus assembly protein PilM